MSTVLAIAIPTFTVMLGVLFTRQDVHALRAEIIALRDKIHRDMIGLHGRIATVEAKHNQ
jgi:hypothetical protein